MDRGAWWAIVQDHKELDTAERLTHTPVILLKKKKTKNYLSVSIENHFMYLQSIKSIFFFERNRTVAFILR